MAYVIAAVIVIVLLAAVAIWLLPYVLLCAFVVAAVELAYKAAPVVARCFRALRLRVAEQGWYQGLAGMAVEFLDDVAGGLCCLLGALMDAIEWWRYDLNPPGDEEPPDDDYWE